MASRAPRNTLSKDRIVAGAVEFADRGGLATLTIRSLAAQLGVRPMSIYHYVATKDELLDAMVDSVFAGIFLPRAEGEWRSELRQRTSSLRKAMRRHPWALAIMESRAQPGPASMAGHEAVLEVLRTAGFSVQATAHAYALLDAFSYGFALMEASLNAVGLEDSPEEVAAGLDLSRHPRMAEQAAYFQTAAEYPLTESFEVGLEMILDGIARLRPLPRVGG